MRRRGTPSDFEAVAADGPQPPRLAAVAWLERTLAAESDRWFLWLPVLFAAGIMAYFGLHREPEGFAVSALAAGALGLCLLIPRRSAIGLAAIGIVGAVSFGFVAAKLRTELVRAPVLAKDLYGAEIEGWIEQRDRKAGGRDRLTIRATRVGTLAEDQQPARIRISVPAARAQGLRTGDAVRLIAALKSPPEPAMPHGFDFARSAWFARLGAVGFATGEVERSSDPPPPVGLAAWAVIDHLRDAVEARVLATVPGNAGQVTNALITGRRAGLPEAVDDTFRDSGLAHVLSISGLHMATMAGALYWLARALMAAFPVLALRWPIRKIAAVVALGGALFYLGLSGAPVPTQRSWLMLSVAFVAILMDRPALTLRNVALAALVILVLFPESLFDISFQMSFAAVTALVALYERIARKRPLPRKRWTGMLRPLQLGAMFLVGTALTTLVASAAVAPFGVYYFQKLTHYALAANLLASPMVTGVIMPMALVSLLAMPFGLEAVPLSLMGWGVELMMGIAAWVASWPGAVSHVPAIPSAALTLMVFGGIWLCLWRLRWRAFGIVIIAVGLAHAPVGRRPDILIERQGKSIALRAEDGRLSLPPDTRANYSAEMWLAADGDGRRVAEAADTPRFYRCDALGCIGTVKGKVVALVRHIAALEEDCREADIVVVPFSVGDRCAGKTVIDRRALTSAGAHALYVGSGASETETVSDVRGDRPWVLVRD